MQERQYAETSIAYTLAKTFLELWLQGKYNQALLFMLCFNFVGLVSTARASTDNTLTYPQYSGFFSASTSYSIQDSLRAPVCHDPESAVFAMQCYELSADIIQQRIIGSANDEDIDKITMGILSAKSMSPVIGEYINVVFNHLPGFQIMPVTIKELFKFKRVAATYDSGTRTFMVAPELAGIFFWTAIAHEFRHAAMHAVEIKRSNNPYTVETNCYYPLTTARHRKIEAHLAQGNKKVTALAKLLELEVEGGLSKKQKRRLKRLRDLYQSEYTERYGGVKKRYYPPYSSVEKANKDLGKIVQAGDYQAEIVGYMLVENQIYPVIRYVDCLRALVYMTIEYLPSSERNYSPRQLLYETDAHMISGLPMKMIEKFYSKFLNDTQTLIKTTFFDSSIYAKPMVFYSDLDALNQASDESVLSIPPKSLTLSLMETILPIIGNFVLDGKRLDECKVLLTEMVKRDFDVAKANAYLGSIAYHQQNYQVAVRYYRRAQQRGQDLYLNELTNFAEALLKTGQYEEAERWCRQALTFSDDTLSWTKSKFEQILAEASSHYVSAGMKKN